MKTAVERELDLCAERMTGLETEVERLRARMNGLADTWSSDLDRIAELEAEVERLRASAAMACENPCGDCAGCNLADDTPTTGGE